MILTGGWPSVPRIRTGRDLLMARIRMSYQAYINSPIWRKKVEEYFSRHRRRCWLCGTTDKIQLHHQTYENMGREEDSDLLPVCETHHRAIHEYHRQYGGVLADASVALKRILRGAETPPAPRTKREPTRKAPRIQRRVKAVRRNQVSPLLAQRDEQYRRQLGGSSPYGRSGGRA
jgi:hypothetical protein